ncbi:alpha-amylase family protein [Lapillicoccus jejuensis]|uniref:Amylosucrase n=1 Tax=Lapillicoccus jejuensis TaxID=402171 RepID=A0A542E016_9MICO|nr:alpha-amylase family protein [Lapillicoccus jejuensis]TQJ08701.1 amylosucrase [Lapillicoccus jejuensis]
MPVPAPAPRAHDVVREALAGLPAHRRRTFTLRVERWWPDLVEPLRRLYGAERADELALDLLRRAATAYGQRDVELHELDERRLLEPDWLQSPRMFGYATYADRFAGTLAGVGERLPYLRELGVTYLHLMPLLLPRDGDNDGGYAVADYTRVRPDLGTMEDLRDLATTLRHEGMSLVLDLVLNHVAREHPWAAAARAGDAAHRDYFHVFPDRTLPDAYERTLPEVFPDFAPGNFTWDEDLQGWVWTTFNAWQWDVDWANPAVLAEYAGVVLDLANTGVEVLRLDAIAFMWKRMGTTCQNEPEVHDITQVLRTVTRLACPAVAFKAEAIVAPRDLLAYLGTGTHAGKVSDLAYHNSLMVQVWSMLATGDVRLTAHAIGQLPPAPTTSTWITYARCHDDIGWAIDDADAAAVGLDGWAHRRFLSDWYSGAFPGSPARGLVFQENPVTGDRRISGTAATLTGLETAGRDRAAVEAAVARTVLAHTVVAGFGGIPVVWSGDELAMVDDPAWADEPGHEDDNRWAHRPRLDWERAQGRHDRTTAEGRVFEALAHVARVRASLPHLHASVASQVLPVDDPAVLALLRRHPVGPMLALYNVRGEAAGYASWRVREAGLEDPVDALTGARPQWVDGAVVVPPWGALWLVGADALG